MPINSEGFYGTLEYDKVRCQYLKSRLMRDSSLKMWILILKISCNFLEHVSSIDTENEDDV